MKRSFVLLAVASLFGAACAYTLDNGVLTVSVGTGDTQTGFTEDQLAGLADAACTELRKTGAGTLVSTGIGSFTGTIRVSAGLL